MIQLPGWNSVDITGRVHNFFELWGIVLFFVVVVFELLAYFYGHRRDWLVDQAARTAEEQHKVEMRTVRQQLSDAERVAAQAQANAAEVRRQQTQRFFTEAQKQTLLEALKPFRGQIVAVVCNRGDAEGRKFALEFVSIFDAVGWNYGTGVVEAPEGNDAIGLRLQVTQPNQGLNFPAANALAVALGTIGWPHMGLQSTGAYGLTVRVGRKPVYQ